MSPNDHEPNQHEHGSPDHAALERLARCAADGELADQDAAALERAKAEHAGLHGFIDSERKMRSAVRRCMAAECQCPQALRDRVAAMCTSATPPLSITGTQSDTQLGPQADTAQAPLRFPMWQRVAAFAAAVVIVVAVSSFVRQGAPTQPAGTDIADGTVYLDELPPSGVQLASFMSNEHNRCASHPTTIRKFTERDLQRVPTAFRDVLGEEITLDGLLMADATFVAAGKCRVPGKGPSIHMMYEAFDQSGNPVEVSLYIQRCGDERFEQGKAYAIGSDEASAPSIIGWRHNQVIYYLVTTSPEMTNNLASRLSAPRLAGAI